MSYTSCGSACGTAARIWELRGGAEVWARLAGKEGGCQTCGGAGAGGSSTCQVTNSMVAQGRNRREHGSRLLDRRRRPRHRPSGTHAGATRR